MLHSSLHWNECDVTKAHYDRLYCIHWMTDALFSITGQMVSLSFLYWTEQCLNLQWAHITVQSATRHPADHNNQYVLAPKRNGRINEKEKTAAKYVQLSLRFATPLYFSLCKEPYRIDTDSA